MVLAVGHVDAAVRAQGDGAGKGELAVARPLAAPLEGEGGWLLQGGANFAQHRGVADRPNGGGHSAGRDISRPQQNEKH